MKFKELKRKIALEVANVTWDSTVDDELEIKHGRSILTLLEGVLPLAMENDGKFTAALPGGSAGVRIMMQGCRTPDGKQVVKFDIF